jgi:hypothetical protein
LCFQALTSADVRGVGPFWGQQGFYHATLRLPLGWHQALRVHIQGDSSICVAQNLLHHLA